MMTAHRRHRHQVAVALILIDMCHYEIKFSCYIL